MITYTLPGYDVPRMKGLSTDEKPVSSPGAMFEETDTGRTFVFSNGWKALGEGGGDGEWTLLDVEDLDFRFLDRETRRFLHDIKVDYDVDGMSGTAYRLKGDYVNSTTDYDYYDLGVQNINSGEFGEPIVVFMKFRYLFRALADSRGEFSVKRVDVQYPDEGRGSASSYTTSGSGTINSVVEDPSPGSYGIRSVSLHIYVRD